MFYTKKLFYFLLINKQNIKNIEERRILIHFNETVRSSFFIVGGANENSVSIEPIYPSIIELTQESPYYNITETTKSNTLITSSIENGLVNISNNLSLAGKSFLFTLESTSNDINFLYGDIDNIAVKGNLINIFYNNSGVPTITILEEFQTIEDYSDITVSVATSSNFLSITPNGDDFIGEIDNTFLDEYPTDGDIVFLKNELEHNGIYRIFQLTETEYSLTLIKKAEELNTIRVSNGREKGVWFSLKVSDEPFTFIKIDDVSTNTKAAYVSGNSTTTLEKSATLIELDIDSSEETPISYYCNLVIRRIPGAVSPPITLYTDGNIIDIFGITRSVSGGALSLLSEIKSYLFCGENFEGQGDELRKKRLSFSWGENNAGGKLWIIIPAPMHSFKVEAFASKKTFRRCEH